MRADRNKAILSGLLVLRILVLIFSLILFKHSAEARPQPSIICIGDAEKLAKNQMAHGFQYSGLVFFHGRLYASCNLGLLEVENGYPTNLYQWSKLDSVVEGPWLDTANGLLWV